jgi:hypothetical protein
MEIGELLISMKKTWEEILHLLVRVGGFRVCMNHCLKWGFRVCIQAMVHFNSNGMVFILFYFLKIPRGIISLIHWSFFNLFIYFIHLFRIGFFFFKSINLIMSFHYPFILVHLFQVRVVWFRCSHFTFSCESTIFDKKVVERDNNAWKVWKFWMNKRSEWNH